MNEKAKQEVPVFELHGLPNPGSQGAIVPYRPLVKASREMAQAYHDETQDALVKARKKMRDASAEVECFTQKLTWISGTLGELNTEQEQLDLFDKAKAPA